jgi:hypothetical protein
MMQFVGCFQSFVVSYQSFVEYFLSFVGSYFESKGPSGALASFRG